jgi:outer membrane protein assembly factor BamB
MKITANNLRFEIPDPVFRVMLPVYLVFSLFAFSGCSATAQKDYEWPCFHGPDRTNKSPETGLLKEWPEGGPELILTMEGLGEGFSSVSIAGGLLYTAGLPEGQPTVFAFDLNGKPVWKRPVGKAWSTNASWASSYIGPRSTPTYDDGVVYFLGEMGLLCAFEAKTGRELWQVDLAAKYEAEPTEYGYSESVMIDGNRLYVRPAGKKGHQVCLDKRTGKQIWANTDIPGLEGYTSPIISTIGRWRQVSGASAICYYGVDTGTGKLLWTVDVVNRQECNITDPVIHDGHVFISSDYGLGSMLFKLNIEGDQIRPEKVWESSLMDNHHGGLIFHEGCVYGSGSRGHGWFCLDFMTGEQRWNATTGEGCIAYADGMLYTLEQRGTMSLVAATPERYEVKGEFKVPSGGKGLWWAHPVICNGRLYLRHAGKIFVYDVSGK